jgi:hypothetical protein
MAYGGASTIRQIKVADPVTILNVTGATEGGGGSLPPFRVVVPDSRLRTKVTVLFSPKPPYPEPFDLTSLGATLYLADMEQDYGGDSAALLPAVALVGTRAAPVAIPLVADLLAWSKEFVTAGDCIQGWLALNNTTGFNGKLVLQARWQPDGQRIPDVEWDEIKRLCQITAAQMTL